MNIINNLKLISIDGLEKCLSILPCIYRDSNIEITIHGDETSFYKYSSLGTTYSGDIGVYHAKEKTIEIFTHHFLNSIDNNSDVANFITLYALIHELRHAVQHKLMPATFNNIISGKTKYYGSGSLKYKEQFVEKDARRFTERWFNRNKTVISKFLRIDSWAYKNNVIDIYSTQIFL